MQHGHKKKKKKKKERKKLMKMAIDVTSILLPQNSYVEFKFQCP